MTTSFTAYLKKIEEDLQRGNATEYTYRGSMEILIESFGKSVDASNDPKHIACGAPDFIVEKGKVPLGYIETKDIGVDLDKVEKTDQMKRYLPALNNLILTDYLEFRWYVNGERRLKARIATVGKNNKLIPSPQGSALLEQLFGDFLITEAPIINTPKDLAIRLAGVTHFIKDQIVAAFESEDPTIKQALEDQYKVFVDLLLPGLTTKEFADLYAQTVTYGLFAAKMTAKEGQTFSLEDAYKYLRRIPFLRRLFQDVNEQLDEIEIIRPYLKDLVSLLNRSDFSSIMADFGKRTRTEDPIVHFYETFLATYDPKLRESRGVYYTPEPIVKFIVRSVDEILKTRFDKPWGLADESVKVLDPAIGTGTFLYYVIQQIHDEIVNNRNQEGQWQEKSKEMLKRLFGFELLIPPYVISHLKLGLLMDSLGTPIEGKDERMHVYLTNTLEEGVERAEMLAGLGSNIAEESNEAAKIKKSSDIMVVLGNPPYSYDSTNNGEWISKLVRDYYLVDGADLGERNPKGLQDDYVKFIRFGEYRIQKTGQGALAFITNHGYLDNPTFRGMRQHLMNTFDEIYVLDLHGNSKKKEKAPDGGKDENVFDIQLGVAIFIGIKHPPSHSKGDRSVTPKVRHAELWGFREDKYHVLHEKEINEIKWSDLRPEKPHYLFIHSNTKLLPEYNNGWKINEIFPINSVGLYTARDHFAIQTSKSDVIKIIKDFVILPTESARTKYELGEDSRDWKIEYAQKDLKDSKLNPTNIVPIAYRPFDNRFTYYTGKSTGFQCMPRGEVMKHIVNKTNIAFCTNRQVNSKFQHVFCSEFITDNCMVSAETKERTYVFPVYLYQTPEDTIGTLFELTEVTREPNLSSAFVKDFSAKLNFRIIPDGQGDLMVTFGPEDVFYYAYAVFHSPTYRSRYAEFLKIDFPRLPLTSDKKLFAKLVKLGKELTELHLLKSAKVEDFFTTYSVPGNNKVEKVVYVSPSSREEGRKGEGRVYINPNQYFGGIPAEVWNFKIGGYQVCDKWLKDRKGRVLSADDISHYQRVIVALNETIRLMKEIDKVIPGFPII